VTEWATVQRTSSSTLALSEVEANFDQGVTIPTYGARSMPAMLVVVGVCPQGPVAGWDPRKNAVKIKYG
jgi:hypothetical protein